MQTTFRPISMQVRFGAESDHTVESTLANLLQAVKSGTRKVTPGGGRGYSTINTTTAQGAPVEIYRGIGGPYSNVSVKSGGKEYESKSSRTFQLYDELYALATAKPPKKEDDGFTF